MKNTTCSQIRSDIRDQITISSVFPTLSSMDIELEKIKSELSVLSAAFSEDTQPDTNSVVFVLLDAVERLKVVQTNIISLGK